MGATNGKTVVVNWVTGIANQTLTVRASNACGTSLNRTLTITLPSCSPREALAADASFSALTAYPNPATDFVNVEFSSNMKSDYRVMLTDLSGRIINVVTGESAEGLNKVALQVSDLNAGMYLITVDHGSDRQTLRLMVE